MALTIESERAETLAREFAKVTGESVEDAVTTAIAERLIRCRIKKEGRLAVLQSLRGRLKSYPVLDPRSDDEILGFDEDGLPR